MVEARVVVEESEFAVVARGEEGRKLNAMGVNANVLIKGRLVLHRWKTENGEEHTKIEIRAEEVERGQE